MKKKGRKKKTNKRKKKKFRLRLKNEGEKYLVETIKRACSINGQPGNEKDILDFIEGEIRSVGEQLVVVRDPKFGLFCVIPSSGEPKETFLIEAHCDIVQPEVQIPFIDKYVISATGLDNRIHVAVILALIKYCRFEHTSFIPLFTIKKEMDSLGANIFAQNITLSQWNGVIWPPRNVIILDATFGKMRNGRYKKVYKLYVGDVEIDVDRFFHRKTEKIPVIGKGFCPVGQSHGIKSKEMLEGMSNFVSFSTRMMYSSSVISLFGCPVVDMHSKISYANVRDVLALFRYLREEENYRKIANVDSSGNIDERKKDKEEECEGESDDDDDGKEI